MHHLFLAMISPGIIVGQELRPDILVPLINPGSYDLFMKTDVVVIGGGASGLFTALDLSTRGADVVLVERGILLSGTSGRFHGLLHSGARYAAIDRAAAVECREESAVIARMAPFAIVSEGGLFIRLKGDDDSYTDRFLKGLNDSGIEFTEADLKEIRHYDPELSPEVDFAVKVPDRVLDPFKLFYSLALLAKNRGVKFFLSTEVTGLDGERRIVHTARGDIETKVVVNAAGPWANKILQMYSKEVNMMPALGVMLVYDARIVHRVINRLRPPSDGDIILPFYQKTIVGTTAQLVEDVDDVEILPEDIQLLVDEGSKMVPILARMVYRRSYYSARPLIGGQDARLASRDFEIIDDDWLVTVIGGKLTTSRLMAERVSDLVCLKLGIDEGCITKDLVLSYAAQRTPVDGTIGEDVYGHGLWLASVVGEISS